VSLKIYFDGGSRPNPGPMETAIVARGRTYIERDLGDGDNNDAEWLAFIHALRLGIALGAADVILIGDSATVVNQVKSGAASNSRRFVPHLENYRELATRFDRLRVRRVGRSQNLAGISLDRANNGLGADPSAYNCVAGNDGRSSGR